MWDMVSALRWLQSSWGDKTITKELEESKTIKEKFIWLSIHEKSYVKHGACLWWMQWWVKETRLVSSWGNGGKDSEQIISTDVKYTWGSHQFFPLWFNTTYLDKSWFFGPCLGVIFKAFPDLSGVHKLLSNLSSR